MEVKEELNQRDTKITLRISEDDLNEIDSFLDRNPRFGSRSEFIRHAAVEYMSQLRIGILDTSNINLKIDKVLLKTLQSAKDKGFFYSIEDAIVDIANQAMINGLVTRIIKDKVEQYKNIQKEMSDLENFDLTKENEL